MLVSFLFVNFQLVEVIGNIWVVLEKKNAVGQRILTGLLFIWICLTQYIGINTFSTASCF